MRIYGIEEEAAEVKSNARDRWFKEMISENFSNI